MVFLLFSKIPENRKKNSFHFSIFKHFPEIPKPNNIDFLTLRKFVQKFAVHASPTSQNFNLFIQIFKSFDVNRKHFGSAEEIKLHWNSKNLESIPHLHSSKASLEKRLKNFDLEVSPPSEVLRKSPAYFKSFPLLESTALNQASSER